MATAARDMDRYSGTCPETAPGAEANKNGQQDRGRPLLKQPVPQPQAEETVGRHRKNAAHPGGQKQDPCGLGKQRSRPHEQRADHRRQIGPEGVRKTPALNHGFRLIPVGKGAGLIYPIAKQLPPALVRAFIHRHHQRAREADAEHQQHERNFQAGKGSLFSAFMAFSLSGVMWQNGREDGKVFPIQREIRVEAGIASVQFLPPLLLKARDLRGEPRCFASSSAVNSDCLETCAYVSWYLFSRGRNFILSKKARITLNPAPPARKGE